MVAAFLSDDHRERLARALLATHSLTDGDLELYEIVKGVDPEAARTWLTRTVREIKRSTEASSIEVEELGDEQLEGLLDAMREDLE